MMGIDVRAIELAHALIVMSAALSYILARSYDVSRRTATILATAVALFLPFIR